MSVTLGSYTWYILSQSKWSLDKYEDASSNRRFGTAYEIHEYTYVGIATLIKHVRYSYDIPYLEIAIDVIYNDLFTGINQLDVT